MYLRSFLDLDDARSRIANWLDDYNQRRLSALASSRRPPMPLSSPQRATGCATGVRASVPGVRIPPSPPGRLRVAAIGDLSCGSYARAGDKGPSTHCSGHAIADGLSIVLTSDTLEETIRLSHTVLVMRDGEITHRTDAARGAKPRQVDLIGHMV
jgi:hypothetical protein